MKNIEILMLLIGILLPAIGSIIKSFKDKSSAKKQTEDSDMLPGNETEAEYYEFEDLEHDTAPKQEFDPFKEVFGDLMPNPQNATPKPKKERKKPSINQPSVQQKNKVNKIAQKNAPRKRIEQVNCMFDESMAMNRVKKLNAKEILRNPNSVKDAIILSEILKTRF